MLGEPGGHLHGGQQAAGGLTQLIQPGREGEEMEEAGMLEKKTKKHVALEVSVGQGIRLVCRRTSSWR